MMKVKWLCLLFVLALCTFSHAKKKKKTDMSFDDLLVEGKYHFSNEMVNTVEQDKVLDALLGVRKDFRDRMKKSARLR